MVRTSLLLKSHGACTSDRTTSIPLLTTSAHSVTSDESQRALSHRSHVRRRAHIPSPLGIGGKHSSSILNDSLTELLLFLGAMFAISIVACFKMYSLAASSSALLLLLIATRCLSSLWRSPTSAPRGPLQGQSALAHSLGLDQHGAVFNQGQLSPQAFQRILSEVHPRSCRGVSPGFLQRLPTRLIAGSRSGVEPRCAICLEVPVAGDEVRSLPCCHTFHRTCIDQWLISRATCPVCSLDVSTV